MCSPPLEKGGPSWRENRGLALVLPEQLVVQVQIVPVLEHVGLPLGQAGPHGEVGLGQVDGLVVVHGSCSSIYEIYLLFVSIRRGGLCAPAGGRRPPLRAADRENRQSRRRGRAWRRDSRETGKEKFPEEVSPSGRSMTLSFGVRKDGEIFLLCPIGVLVRVHGAGLMGLPHLGQFMWTSSLLVKNKNAFVPSKRQRRKPLRYHSSCRKDSVIRPLR